MSRADFFPTASGDPWNPTATQVGPSDESKLLVKMMAGLAVARSVSAAEDVARPTVSQTGQMKAAEFAFRRC